MELRVVRLAILSRSALLALLALTRAVVGPYDTSAGLDVPCLGSSGSVGSSASGLGRVLEESVVWDGVYYVRIAQCGYEYEQTHAFLPLLPLAMRLLATTVFSRLTPLLGFRATLALAGYVINNAAFVLAACYLYRLSRMVLQDESCARRATALFCFNPASVFYSSIYSESLFSLLSFAGLWHLVSGAKWKAVLLFALSCAVRSNGVLHAGFFLFEAMHEAAASLALARATKSWPRAFARCLKVVLIAFLQTLGTVAPFLAFQAFGYYRMCHDPSRRQDRGWCSDSIPYIYGFVQSRYWNVGLFRYFELKQLPNFLLASPMLLLATCTVTSTAARQKLGFLALGLPESLKHMRGLRVGQCDKTRKSTGFGSYGSLCFVYQLAVMTAVVALVMHVQVATRFLSVSPALYWFAAEAKGVERLVWLHFLVYSAVGTLLFANFYPFT